MPYITIKELCIMPTPQDLFEAGDAFAELVNLVGAIYEDGKVTLVEDATVVLSRAPALLSSLSLAWEGRTNIKLADLADPTTRDELIRRVRERVVLPPGMALTEEMVESGVTAVINFGAVVAMLKKQSGPAPEPSE